VKSTHAQKLYEAAQEPKRLEMIEEGADHARSQREHLQNVIDLSLEWLKNI